MTREEVYTRINSEPQKEGPNPLSVGESILLMEEYLELARLHWRKQRPPEDALRMILKVAAIAVNSLEQNGS